MTVEPAREEKLHEQLSQAMEKYKDKPGGLIPALQEAQQIFGYLPRKVMIQVAVELDIPLAEVYSVVSFYSLFSTIPMGKQRLEVCTGTACYVRGAEKLLHGLREKFGIKEGEVTEDGMFSVASARCVGACSAAPVIKVGEEIYGDITDEQLNSIIEELKEK